MRGQEQMPVMPEVPEPEKKRFSKAACAERCRFYTNIYFAFFILAIVVLSGVIIVTGQKLDEIEKENNKINFLEEDLDKAVKLLKVAESNVAPLFFTEVESYTGYSLGVKMIDPATGEAKTLGEVRDAFEGNDVLFAVPQRGYDGRIFVTTPIVQGASPGLKVASIDVNSDEIKNTKLLVANSRENPMLSVDQTRYITVVEYLDEDIAEGYNERQILVYNLLTGEVEVAGEIESGADIDPNEPSARVAGLRDYEARWTDLNCMEIVIHIPTPEIDGDLSPLLDIRGPIEYQQFCLE